MLYDERMKEGFRGSSPFPLLLAVGLVIVPWWARDIGSPARAEASSSMKCWCKWTTLTPVQGEMLGLLITMPHLQL